MKVLRDILCFFSTLLYMALAAVGCERSSEHLGIPYYTIEYEKDGVRREYSQDSALPNGQLYFMKYSDSLFFCLETLNSKSPLRMVHLVTKGDSFQEGFRYNLALSDDCYLDSFEYGIPSSGWCSFEKGTGNNISLTVNFEASFTFFSEGEENTISFSNGKMVFNNGLICRAEVNKYVK